MLVIKNLLGIAANGHVFQGRFGDQSVAIKAFDRPECGEQEAEIQKEIEISRKLAQQRHPHIIQFLGTDVYQDQPCLIMELIENRVVDVIRRETLDWPKRVRIAEGVARGLEYVHRFGILHCNIRSASVYITYQGGVEVVKLGGFGAADSIVSLAGTSNWPKVARESTRWWAPELFEWPKYSTKSDVYALGMMMWEMAANCTKPFKEQSSNVVMIMVKRGEREVLPDDTPVEYRKWVERCWAQNPLDRPEASDIVFTGGNGGYSMEWSSIPPAGLPSPISGSSTYGWVQTPKEYISPVDQGGAMTPSSGHNTKVEYFGPQSPNTFRDIEVSRSPYTSRSNSMQEASLTLGARIGEGGYGTVFHGHWGSRKVAVKKYKISRDEAKHASGIQQEIQMLQHLQDRYIIQFYGVAYHEDNLVLIMDYAEGGSLNQAIRRGHLKGWEDNMRIAREIARGVAFIHQQGVLHRDLKSGNVLLTQDMRVKLCDFGLAKIKLSSESRSDGDGSCKGTLRWMAPELLTTKPKYSTKSDMYALGMVMWEMAANCTRPFQDQPEDGVVIQLVKYGEREVLPDHTPSGYRAWVHRCWEQDPSMRPEAIELATEDNGGDNSEPYGEVIPTLSFSSTYNSR